MSSSAHHSHACCDGINPRAWSIAQLKQFLTDNNVSTKDCLEKQDYIDKALLVLSQPSHSHASQSSSASSVSMANTSGNTSSTTHSTINAQDFQYHVIPVGPLQCNCCLLIHVPTKEALLVDPGGDEEEILQLIKKHQVTVKQILVTHGHFDHFLAADAIRKATKAPVALGTADLPLWKALPMQCVMFGIRGPQTPLADPDILLNDGDKLPLLNGVAIHTPGHSPGSTCFYFEDFKFLCSGDTLFKLSVGRTDLPGGSFPQLQSSIQTKLYTLPSDVLVVPGHNEFTSIGFEAQHNTIVKASTKASSKI